MDKNNIKEQLELVNQQIERRRVKVMRLNELENILNIDGIPWREDKKYLKQKNLFETLIKKMLYDGKITEFNLDFKNANNKPKIFFLALERLPRLGPEFSMLLNSNLISDYMKCFIILKLLEANYELLKMYLEPFARKINPNVKLEDKCGVIHLRTILNILANYDNRFNELFEDLKLDIRGSIAHEQYEILDEGKSVLFKFSGVEKIYSLTELAKINSYQTMMFNFIMVISSQLQLEYIKSQKTELLEQLK